MERQYFSLQIYLPWHILDAWKHDGIILLWGTTWRLQTNWEESCICTTFICSATPDCQAGKNRRNTPQNQKHPDKWKPLKIFILQSISALALPLADFPKCHCFLCKSTASSTWTKNMWASWFLFLLPSQANWAVLLHKASVGVGQAKLDREGCTGAISEAHWQRLPCC